MNAADIIEIALDIGNRIDVQWGLFVTVHLAVLGAMAYVDEPLHPVEKSIALVIYFGFATINFIQMSAQLDLLNAAYADIAQISGTERGALITRMAKEHLSGRHEYSGYIIAVSHGLMLVLVTLSVVFHPLMTKKDKL